MRIFIVTDIEGVAGVVTDEQASGGGGDYADARRWLTRSVNACCAAAFDAGADFIRVSDGHNRCRNLLLDELDPRVEALTGKFHRTLGPMEGIGADFDAMFQLGFHGMAGSEGVLPHSVHGIIREMRVGGVLCGELLLNALLAASFGVPTLLVTGDRAACLEARAQIPGVLTAETMAGSGMNAAYVHNPSVSCAAIADAVGKAVRAAKASPPAPVPLPQGPIPLELVFSALYAADGAALMPGVRKTGPYTCEFCAPDMPTLMRVLQCMIILATQNH